MAGVRASADGEHRQELDLGVAHRHRGIGIAPVDRIGEAAHVPLGLGSIRATPPPPVRRAGSHLLFIEPLEGQSLGKIELEVVLSQPGCRAGGPPR